MSLAELNRHNFRFNAMPTSVPSGMYGIILKNSNASVVHNLLLNSDETIKANFGVFDNSNLLCTKNLISGDVVKLQGNSYVSEFDNGISGSIFGKTGTGGMIMTEREYGRLVKEMSPQSPMWKDWKTENSHR